MANDTPSNTFSRILDKAAMEGITRKTDGAIQWFRDTAKATRTTSHQFKKEFDRDRFRSPSQLGYGYMYCYNYNPKGKDELPYYDTFPLIFLVGKFDGGFYGINFHYLPYKLRAVLMDALYDVVSNKKYDENTKLKISYDILQSASKYKYFKPCLKKYLYSHVQGRILKINSNEWDMALFLPLSNFKKASVFKVWADSVNIANGKKVRKGRS